jgi:hypothetical protein
MSKCPLTRFGYTEREAEWLRHVLLHSGVFLRRQYLAWIGDRKRGAVDQRLLAHLLYREHAAAWSYHRRERVYHLTNKALYEAIGEPDLRHRRALPAHRFAQKLMLLDMTIQERQHSWLATEDEKVSFFRERGTHPSCLPHRVYRAGSGLPDTTRYFVDRFPILVEADGRVGIVYPDFAGHADAFAQFLKDHMLLLLTQRDAGVVYVTDRDSDAARAEATFHNVLGILAASSDGVAARFLEYCVLRRSLDDRLTSGLEAKQEERFDRLRQDFEDGSYEALYRMYRTAGALSASDAVKARNQGRVPIRFRHVALPYRYFVLGRPTSSSSDASSGRASRNHARRSKRDAAEPSSAERE